MMLSEIMDIIREEDFNVTLSGGDPLMDPEGVRILVDAITAEGFTVWIYTGFTWEEIVRRKDLRLAVSKAETVVEGPFIESLRKKGLKFRGSTNQRFIHPSEMAD